MPETREQKLRRLLQELAQLALGPITSVDPGPREKTQRKAAEALDYLSKLDLEDLRQNRRKEAA